MDDRGERASRTGGFTERESLDAPPDRATEDDAPETTRGDQPGAASAAPLREESETPEALERGGPAGTLPVGPAGDDVADAGPPMPGAPGAREAAERRAGTESEPEASRRPEGEGRRPLTSWTRDEDDEPGDAPGVGQPPG